MSWLNYSIISSGMALILRDVTLSNFFKSFTSRKDGIKISLLEIILSKFKGLGYIHKLALILQYSVIL